MNTIPLAFVDVETTGMSLKRDRIIEIGIIRVENNTIVDTYQSLINPQAHLPKEIEKITGITTSDLEKAPLLFEIKDRIIELIEGCVLVAHNARFDYGFLKHELKRMNYTYSAKQLCTVKLSRYLYPLLAHHNLDTLIQTFQFSCSQRHRAFDDAKVLWDFYQHIYREFPKEHVDKALQYVTRRCATPPSLSSQTIDELPEGPGVYIFYGKDGMPLYIGKSINIRDRVMSHFSSTIQSSLEMKISQQIESIETFSTTGELSALFKESYLIKKMQPLYNRKLRISKKLIVLKKRLNIFGYYEVDIAEVDEQDLLSDDLIIHVFRSKRQAKEFIVDSAKGHNLCEKLLQLEKTKSFCFGYRLGRCKGACMQEENVQKYNLRCMEAFASHAIKPWPFLGPILIEENNDLTQDIEALVFDKWCFIGSIKSDETATTQFVKSDNSFDMDTYKILLSYLKIPKNRQEIKQVGKDILFNYLGSM